MVKNTYLASIGLLIGISLLASSIPIGNTMDAKMDITLTFPVLASTAQLTSAQTTLTQHTLYSLPDIGGILTTGTLKIKVEGGGQTASRTVGTLTRSDQEVYHIPTTTHSLIITLYENDIQIDQKVVSI
jgi:hypothetical protein